MTELMQRATRAAKRVVARRGHFAGRTALEDEQAADEYARSLGMHLSPDEQQAWFKRATEGAPLVSRPLRRHVV